MLQRSADSWTYGDFMASKDLRLQEHKEFDI